MRTCYLHVGLPKTGSTSIQKSFRDFENDAVVYPKSQWPNHLQYFTISFSKRPLELPYFKRTNLSDEAVLKRVAEVRQELDRLITGRKDVIFSGETILDYLKSDEVTDLIRYLKAAFDRIQVIAYIRPPASLLPSQFQEKLKKGLTQFKLPPPRFRERFGTLIEDVGTENVTFIRYNRADLIGGDVLVDFSRRVGLEGPPKPVEPVNESLSAEAIATIFKQNQSNKGRLPDAKFRKRSIAIQKKMKTIQGTTFGLSDELVMNHLKEHAEDIAWMERVCGFDLRAENKKVEHPIGSEADLLALAVSKPAGAKRKPDARRENIGNFKSILAKVKSKIW